MLRQTRIEPRYRIATGAGLPGHRQRAITAKSNASAHAAVACNCDVDVATSHHDRVGFQRRGTGGANTLPVRISYLPSCHVHWMTYPSSAPSSPSDACMSSITLTRRRLDTVRLQSAAAVRDSRCRASSSRATRSRCTSSAPSPIRTVRWYAYISASGRSCETPRPPRN